MTASFTDNWIISDWREIVIRIGVGEVTFQDRTSILENKSLSTNSATPISRTEASANATPISLVLNFEEGSTKESRFFGQSRHLIQSVSGLPAALEDPIFMAMTIGADRMSVFPNSRSSTA